jgi:ABC-type uncharacterized transport system ATPase component
MIDSKQALALVIATTLASAVWAVDGRDHALSPPTAPRVLLLVDTIV